MGVSKNYLLQNIFFVNDILEVLSGLYSVFVYSFQGIELVVVFSSDQHYLAKTSSAKDFD